MSRLLTSRQWCSNNKYYTDMKCVTWAVRTSAYHIQNIAGTKSVHTIEDQVTRFSVNVCYSRQYVVAYCNQDAVSCTCDEMSGPKDRSVRTYGPKCLGIRTELSWVRCVSKSDGVKTLRTQDTSDLRHFGTTVMVPKCRSVRTFRHYQVLFVHKKKATCTHY